MPANHTAQPDERVRQHRALELRLTGMQYAAIAEATGYADKASAYVAVRAVLDRQESESAAEHRRIEDIRLDALFQKYWPKAMAGDHKSADLVLKLHDRRVKLHGLAAPTKVVVGGMSAEEFTSTVAEDIRALGIDPAMDTPLVEQDGGDDWANT